MNRRHLVVSATALAALTAPRLVVAQDATPLASLETCPATTPEQNTAVARQWYEVVLTGHDLAALDAIVLPGSQHDSPNFPDTANSRTILEALLTGFPDLTATVEQTVAEGDFVTIRWSLTGTHTGEFQGFAPTGRVATVTGINIFRFDCGRIAEVWSQADVIGQFRQLGLPLDAPASSAATPTS